MMPRPAWILAAVIAAGCALENPRLLPGASPDAAVDDSATSLDTPVFPDDARVTNDLDSPRDTPPTDDATLDAEAAPDVPDVPDVPVVPCGFAGQVCCAMDATLCSAGLVCVSERCACPPPQSLCATGCVDTRDDLANCGGCSVVCPERPNAARQCTMGTCGAACNPGFADCDANADNGCETPTGTMTDCGGCGMACAAGQACRAGACITVPPTGCTGGITADITVAGAGYRVHTFDAVGAAGLRCEGAGTVEYLVVGGGGGGGSGRAGGGGGAGGYRTGSLVIAAGDTAILVGDGGARAASGGASSLGAVTSAGGGAGGHGDSSSNAAGRPGGSGGGGGFKNVTGGVGTPMQGHAGGAARSGNWIAGGGGGGAGGAGTRGAGDNEGDGGNGGAGLSSDISGMAVVRAGGGAGRGEHNDGAAGTGGAGVVGAAGLPKSGSGGGANAAGGSGVVIVRYRLPAVP